MAQQSGPVSFFATDPEAQRSYLDLQRRQAIAAALSKQGMDPLDISNRQVGGVAYRVSPLEGFAKALQAYTGKKMQDQATKDQATLQANYLRSLTTMMGGDQNQSDNASARATTPDSFGASPIARVLAQGAASGSVGPTNDNAQRLAALLRSQGADTESSTSTDSAGDVQSARDRAGLTNNAPARVPSNVGFQPSNAGSNGQTGTGPAPSPLNPTGIPPQVAAQLYMLDPAKYLQTVASQTAPTDLQKTAAAAGFRPGTAEYQRYMQAHLEKDGYIPPVPIRPGGGVMDRAGNITTLPAAAPAGYQMARNADGTWSYQPVAGGLDAVQGSARAQARGTAATKPTQGYNSNTNQYTYSNEAVDADLAYGPNGTAPGGMIGGAPGGAGAPINNPGNMRNPGQSTGFAQFSSPQDGLQAIDKQLQLYGSRGLNTVGQIVSTWAPRSENDTASYVRHVSQVLGVNPNQPLDMGNPAVRQALSTAIMLHEQGPQRLFGGGAVGSGSMVPKPAPGAVEAQTTLANNNAQRLTQTLNQAQDSATRVNVLDNVLALSRNGVLTGPTADMMNRIKGYVAGMPGADAILPKWKDDVSGFQELSKFLYQNAQRNWQAAGGTGTDAQLEAFSKSNPNPTMFPQAIQAVAEWSKAGELALQGRASAMQNYANANPQNIARLDKFEQAWRSNFDPVLFQLKAMDFNRAQAYTENLQRANPKAYQALMQKAANLKQMGAY